MDNITSFIIENKTWLLIVLAIGGSIWGIDESGADKMVEERKLHKAPTDRMFEFRVYVVLSTLMFVVPSLVILGFILYAASQTNITLLPVVLLGAALLVFCKILFQYGVHVFKLCTWSIPSQRKIDLHQKGIDYFHEGDYENAMKCFLSSCKFHGIGLFAGWATSECYIGRMFFEGKGVNKDYETAVKWFRKATELLCFGPGLKISDPNACEWLGYCYEHGYGVEEDSDVALHWYKEAADLYKKDDDGRLEDVKKRWEKLSGESYDESESDEEEDADGDEVDDDDNAVDEDEEEFDDIEKESDEEENSAGDDEDGDDEDGEESEEEEDEDYVDPMDELTAMIGLESVKKQGGELRDFMTLQEERREKGLRVPSMSCHCVFTGNPGTGKTTVARIIARIYSDMGVIGSDKLVETDRSGLVAEYSGQTASKTNQIIDSALDGVLFIDEAYTLVNGDDDDFGREAVNTLLKRMEDDRDRLVVIVAGYTNEMRRFMDSNPGLKRRFSRTIEFPDYNAEELSEIFFSLAEQDDYICSSDTKNAVLSVAHDLLRFKDKNVVNAGTVRNLYQETVMRMTQRLTKTRNRSRKALQTILPEDLPPRTVGSQENVDAILDEIDDMIGLVPVKEELRRLVASVRTQKAREKAGIKSSGASYHCVFTGNPGTGKTTIARAMAKIYHALGILATEKFVETDRSNLVAEYVGQTAVKTNDVIDSALDGVLFIDEAYTLASKGKEDFGQEAIDTLLKRMEDNRNRLVVIVAGYTDDMKRFIAANSGLKSRFTRYIDFPDYSAEELLQMFKKTVSKNQYACCTDAEAEFFDWMKDDVSKQEKGFGNGRFVRTCFERIVEQQALRLDKIAKPTHKQLKELTVADVRVARKLVKA